MTRLVPNYHFAGSDDAGLIITLGSEFRKINKNIVIPQVINFTRYNDAGKHSSITTQSICYQVIIIAPHMKVE